MTTTTEPPVGTPEQMKEAVDLLTATLIKDRGPADAVALLQELLSDEVDEAVVDNCPAMGCCGCGAWMADVRTPGWEGAPGGESYCWTCVDSPGHSIAEYIVLPGRER
jgi:hypothetical protein